MFNKKLLTVALIIASVLQVFILAPSSSAVAPRAAKLIDPSTNTVVTIANFPGGVRGITTNGSKVYAHSSSHGNAVIFEFNFDGTGLIERTITNPPTDVTFYQSNLALSNGCIWSSSHNGALYCTSTSTWTSNQVAVPADKPLPSGTWWMYSNMMDFPDGRIGRISAPFQTSTGYASTLRVYNVNGTGNAATVTWSEDFTLIDTESWPGDDHGIATDGVYMYRILCCSSTYKSWKLVSGADSPIAHFGEVNEEDGLGNATYITHDHVNSRYIIGDYDGPRFYLTASENPGTGPGVTTTTTTTATTTTTTSTSTSTTLAPLPVAQTTTTAPPTLDITVNAPGTTTPVGQMSIATIAPKNSGVTTSTVPTPMVTAVTTASTIPVTTQPAAPKIAAVDNGAAAVQVAGKTTPATVSREKNQMVISAGAMSVQIAGIGSDGGVSPLDNDGNITLKPGSRVRIRATGFIPGSEIEAWIFSDPFLLGTLNVDAAGTVVGTFAVPEEVPNGAHRVVIVAKRPGEQDTTFTLGIGVDDYESTLKVPAWLIATPIALAIGFAMFLPPALRRRKRRI